MRKDPLVELGEGGIEAPPRIGLKLASSSAESPLRLLVSNDLDRPDLPPPPPPPPPPVPFPPPVVEFNVDEDRFDEAARQSDCRVKCELRDGDRLDRNVDDPPNVEPPNVVPLPPPPPPSPPILPPTWLRWDGGKGSKEVATDCRSYASSSSSNPRLSAAVWRWLAVRPPPCMRKTPLVATSRP